MTIWQMGMAFAYLGTMTVNAVKEARERKKQKEADSKIADELRTLWAEEEQKLITGRELP
jgi:hypothetical protein